MSLDKNYQGTDVNLETSLEEYGFVARPITVDYADEYFVIYKMDDNQYGSGHIRESELDAIVDGTEWASEEDVNSMLETVGASKEEWMDLPFTSKFSDLVSYWGTENIMGTDYYPNDKNWAFEEIGLESDSMDLDDLVDYVVPSHYAYALVNGDYSGLSDEEEQELNEFTETVIERTGNANFIISDNDEGEYFTPANDINNLGSTVRKVYIRPSNSFAWGGESKIPTSMVKKKLIGKTILYNDYQEYVISDVKYAKNGATTLWDYSLYFEDEPNMVIILSQSEMYHLYKIGEVTLNYMAEGSKLRIQSIYQKTNDKINKFYRKIERETNIGFSDEEVEELIADVKSKSNKDGKDYTVYVKDGKLLFDESLSRNLRLDPNKNKIADISPNKRIFRYYADHRLGNGGGVDITSLKKGDVITILGDSYKFLRYETENDEEKTVVLDLKDNSIVSMPKDMVEAYSKYKFAKGGGVDKELYEITLEDIFSFATQSKTTELTDAQYRSILEQKKNGDIVIDRYNQKQGIHEKLRIKSVTKKFAKGGGVESKYKVGQKFYDTRYDRTSQIVSNKRGLITWKRFNKTGTEFENNTEHSLVENQFDYLVQMGAYQLSKQFADGGGVKIKSAFRLYNSPLIKFANFKDGSHINLMRLIKPYKNGEKYGISKMSINKIGDEVRIFKTLEDAESYFDRIVNQKKKSVDLREEVGTTKKYGKGGVLGTDARLEYVTDAYASGSLQEELKEKLGIETDSLEDNYVISFAYTDYGGDFIDKVAIAYFKENYPNNTLFENAGYNGENAYVFGEPAKEWIETTQDYPLGFEDIEDFYYEKTSEQENEDFNYFLDEIKGDYSFDKDEALQWLNDNRGGYFRMTTQGLDFSFKDLTNDLVNEGVIEPNEEDEDDDFADGGGVELNGKKVGVAKRLKIKNWYLKTYPTDDLGKEIKDNLSFWSLYTLMSQRYNVYSVLQVSDSLVRERVFQKLSEILGVEYDYIYKMWLRSSDEYVNGGGIMADGRIVLRDFNGIGGNKNKTYKLIKDDRDSDGKPYYTLIEHPSNKVMAQGDNFEEVNGYADLMSGKFAKGGMVVYLDGKKSETFKTKKSLYEFVRGQVNNNVKKVEIDYGNRIIPTFDTYIIENGKLIHKGELIQPNIDKEEVERKRLESERNINRMMGYAKGGGVGNVSYEKIYGVLKDKIEESTDDLGRTYENSSDFTGEEIEHKFRDGFIPYTNGGYELSWYEYVSMMYGTGYSLPTEKLQAEMQRHVDYSYELAKDNFKDTYPEIVEVVGEDNIDYNSLDEAGFTDEAEELSNWEMEYLSDEDTIRCSIIAYYYEPTNEKGQDGKHTISLQGDINLEAPYHRKGKNDDFTEVIFTFDSMEELKSKLEDGLKNVIDWFNGSKPTGSDDDTFARGGKAKPKAPKIVRTQFEEGEYEYADGGEIKGVGKFGLDKIIKESKENPTQLYLVTDDNYSNIGHFYLKNGKFAKRTVDNENYDFENSKVTLKPKSDVIYKSIKLTRKLADGGGVEIDRIFESENDSLNTFKGYNDYFCIEFNGKVLHSVKTKSQHLKKLNELVDKYNLTEIKQKNSEFSNGGGVEINSVSELYDWEEASNYPYARDMVAYFIFGDRDDNIINKAIKGVYSKESADESKLSEIMLGYEYNWMENMEQLDVDTVEALGDLMDYYANGGGVDDADWIEESLIDLQNETGFDDLVVENSDNNHYTASNGDAEFEVFETEDDARERAIERVKEDLEENPEYFNRTWIMNYIDGNDFFTDVYNEWNYGYVNDIENEGSNEYSNRLIEEMVENGIISSEEAKEEDFDAEDYKDAFVELMTNNQIEEGNGGLQHYIYNFGEEQAFKVVLDNNLIDTDFASKDAVDTDGIAHFLSSYDGKEIELSNGHVAYRTN